ncbi:MAG: hypothetical protein HUU06_01270 [Planctomycetaceae bacterium]|nr:hypothetical protein [Planctomycetaceae bacterium]
MAAEAYCVKCRKKSEMVATQEVTMSNGKLAMRGKCRTCGTGMYKILGAAKKKPEPKTEESSAKAEEE